MVGQWQVTSRADRTARGKQDDGPDSMEPSYTVAWDTSRDPTILQRWLHLAWVDIKM